MCSAGALCACEHAAPYSATTGMRVLNGVTQIEIALEVVLMLRVCATRCRDKTARQTLCDFRAQFHCNCIASLRACCCAMLHVKVFRTELRPLVRARAHQQTAAAAKRPEKCLCHSSAAQHRPQNRHCSSSSFICWPGSFTPHVFPLVTIFISLTSAQFTFKWK